MFHEIQVLLIEAGMAMRGISVDFDSWGINTGIDSSDIDKESVESILIDKESILPK